MAEENRAPTRTKAVLLLGVVFDLGAVRIAKGPGTRLRHHMGADFQNLFGCALGQDFGSFT